MTMWHRKPNGRIKYQFRYRAYCAVQGRSCLDQKVHDRAQWPGGAMAGFILWIGEQWAEWSRQSGEARSGSESMRAPWSKEQHEMFDAWLSDCSGVAQVESRVAA